MNKAAKVASTMLSKNNLVFKNGKFLNSLLPILRDELSKYLTTDLDESSALLSQQRICKIFDYNVAGGKFARSNLAMQTFTALSPKSITEEELITAGKVALTIELLQTFYLIEDDIMDSSILRRGRPSWHSLAKQKTVIGQMLDMNTTDLSEFTWSRYSSIVKHKTRSKGPFNGFQPMPHYSYLLPLNIGMHLADYTTPHQVQLRQIAYDLGYLFQAQDDYLDCFGDSSITGKSNLVDLAEGKCTWVTCALIEKLEKTNKSVELDNFKKNFSTKDENKLIIARNIIVEQGIEEDCLKFQKQKVSELHQDIMSYPIEPIRHVLELTLDEMTGRQK
uniref:Farnesyl pyrophosphate synthase n=1 Tax=Meloidogyne javanica TaxID=6303 RepID=A0A915LF85_MELJA